MIISSKNISTWLKLATLMFVVGFLFFGLTSKASAATYYWYGGTGNWSDYANHWSTNSGNSPSSPAANAPLSTDSVVFNASSGSGTATIDPTTVTIAGFDASATSVIINDGGHTVTVNGNILITSTASKFASSGTWTQGASGNIIDATATNSFKKLVIASSGVTSTMTGSVWVGYNSGGTLTLGSGSINGGGSANTLYLYTSSVDALTVGNLTVGTPLGRLYLNFNTSVTQKAFTLPNNLVSNYVAFSLNGSLTATGDFNFGNNAVDVFSLGVTGIPTYYLDMSTYTLTSGVLELGTTTYTGYIKLGSSIANSIAGITAVVGTAVSNALNMGSSVVACSGNVNLTNIGVTPGTSTLVMTGTSSLTSAGQSLNNVTYNSLGTLTLNDDTTIGGNLNIVTGTLSPGATTVIMNGNGKTLTTHSQALNNFEVSGNTTLGSSLALSGNLTIDSGKTLDTSSSNYAVSVAGNWTNPGTFTGNNSLVTLNGSGSQTMTGSNTFYQLSALASSANNTLTFANGTTQTVSSALTLTGLGGNVLFLRSDSPTHQWNVTPNGSRTVDHVDVQDSNNTVVATPIVATNSIDSGNNTDWTITPPPLTVSVQTASSVTQTSAVLNGNIMAIGSGNPFERGFNLYNGGTCSGAIIQNPKDTGGSYGIGAYSKTVTGLSSVTQYSYTAYAVNSSDTETSACESFTPGGIYYIVNGNNTWVRGSISSNKDIAQQYVTFGLTNNDNFNFGNAYIINNSTPNSISNYTAGTSLANNGDDATPVNTLNAGFLMADHGLASPVITATTDKTSSDVGSTWHDSAGHQFVIASVSGSGTETITLYSIPSGSPWTYATVVSGTTLTWVSGGTHQGSITITSQADVQQYPVVKNIVHHILANGVTEVTDGASGYADYVDMSEEFDVIDPSTINTTNNPFVWNDASVWLHVKNVFHATAGTTVIHSTYTVSRPMNLGYFSVIQVAPLIAPSYDHQYYYIPKTKPIGGYDFSTPQLLDSAPSSSVIFNSPYITDVSNPPDRQIILLKKNADSNYDIGFAFGYSPYGSTAASNRSCATLDYGCWWIYTSKKTYPVMSGGSVVNNTTYDAYAYRQFIDPTSYDIGKSAYWNNLNGHELLYVDYHRSATNDVTTVPSQFAGWNVKVIDSANISTPPSTVAGDGTVTLSTTGSSTSGYAVLELYAPSTITASAGANGSVTPSGFVSVNNGSDQAFTITPNSGYHISTLAVDGGAVSVRSLYTFTNVTANHTISATFAADTVSSPIVSHSGGCISCGVLPSAPTGGFNVFINQNISSTSSRIVTLNFNAKSDIKNMAISLSGDFSDASQERYSSTKQLDLCSKFAGSVKSPTCPDGTYTVYVKFYTQYGQASDVFSSKINLVTSSVNSKAPTYNFGITTLKNGSNGEAVKELQRFLNTTVRLGLVVDGRFGAKTLSVIRKWQEAQGLVPDGLVGPKTKAKMNTVGSQ